MIKDFTWTPKYRFLGRRIPTRIARIHFQVKRVRLQSPPQEKSLALALHKRQFMENQNASLHSHRADLFSSFAQPCSDGMHDSTARNL